jgi:hypothetical protein
MKIKNLNFAYQEFGIPLFYLTKSIYCKGDYLIIHRKKILLNVIL